MLIERKQTKRVPTDLIYIIQLYYEQICRDRKQIIDGQGIRWQWQNGERSGREGLQ